MKKYTAKKHLCEFVAKPVIVLMQQNYQVYSEVESYSELLSHPVSDFNLTPSPCLLELIFKEECLKSIISSSL